MDSKPIVPMYSPIELRRPATKGTNERGRTAPTTGIPFDHMIAQAQNQTNVRVSGHAMQRLKDRGITLDSLTLTHVSYAMDELKAKGAKESLVVCDKALLIVNVPNRTIVTALDQSQSKNNVFTNIDSAIVI